MKAKKKLKEQVVEKLEQSADRPDVRSFNFAVKNLRQQRLTKNYAKSIIEVMLEGGGYSVEFADIMGDDIIQITW